ncbi:MAG: glycosyltransferase family 39 protein [Caldilineaceae bacterium]
MKSLQKYLLLLLILAAFAWRVQGVTNQSLWRDEIDAIYFALRDLPATLGMFVQMAQNGPLYFLTLRLWFYVAGATPFALRYLSVVAGTVAIPLTWLVARRILRGNVAAVDESPRTRWLALGAVLLLAINPYQLWYGQEGKMYTLITALALLAHWFWLKGISGTGWRPWLGYFVTVSLALYSHLLMIILIPLHMVWFLLAWSQSRRQWRGYLVALAGLTLPYLPFVWWQWGMLTSAEKLTGFTFVPLTEIFRTLLWNHSYGLLPPAPWLRLTPIFFLGLVGLLLGADVLAARVGAAAGKDGGAESFPFSHRQEDLATRLRPWQRYSLILAWLFFPIIAIYLLSLRQPVYTDRYVIWIAPAAMLVLVLGLCALYQNAGLLGKPLTALFLLYLVIFWLYVGWEQKTTTLKYDLRSAVTYVAQKRDPATLLILQIPHMEYAYRYYTSDFSPSLWTESDAHLGKWVGGLWTNGGEADEQANAIVAQEMEELTAGHTELWLLSSEVEMWDNRHLMDGWLNAHAEVMESADFHGAQVRHYILNQ